MPKNKFSGTFITQIKYSISLEVGEQAKLLPDLSFANSLCTGKSFSEVLILASTNPQYDKTKRLSIELSAESQFGQNDTLARDTLAGTLWPE